MSGFDQFTFLRNREAKLPLTQEERETFTLWPTLVAMSMSKADNMPLILDKMNTLGFSRLPKELQAVCITQFDGKKLSGQWQKQKETSKKVKKEYILRICKIFDCSENDAKSAIDNNRYDENVINDLYERLYETENIKFRKRS